MASVNANQSQAKVNAPVMRSCEPEQFIFYLHYGKARRSQGSARKPLAGARLPLGELTI